MWLSNTNSHDWPSGADFATLAAPTTPVPPGLLSTLICQPVFSISLAWITRVMGSVEPPGGNGTTNLIRPFGQSAWARAIDRKSGVEGKRVDLGGRRSIKK